MRVLGLLILTACLIGCSDRRSLETYHQSTRVDRELTSRYQESNSPTEEYVNRVAKRVLSVSDRSDLHYNIQVSQDVQPILNIDRETNTIVITSGALMSLHDEAQLAAALTLGMQQLEANDNFTQAADMLNHAGYDPHALLDLQEQYLFSNNRQDNAWLIELFPTPPTSSSINANKLLIDKLAPGGQRGAEDYVKRIRG